jgi:hypothetical protein
MIGFKGRFCYVCHAAQGRCARQMIPKIFLKQQGLLAAHWSFCPIAD